MAAKLIDFRVGIPQEYHDALNAEAAAFGIDKQEVAREIFKEWSDRRHRAARILIGRALRDGGVTASDGGVTESGGLRRQSRRKPINDR